MDRESQAEIYRAQPDVGAVVRSHAASVVPFTVAGVRQSGQSRMPAGSWPASGQRSTSLTLPATRRICRSVIPP